VVRRIVDLLLIAAILGAVGIGAYYIGHNVDRTSNNLAKRDSELGQTTYHRADPKGPSRRTFELVGISVASVAGVMIIVSVGGALLKTRKRQRWHAT
jgi:hypothetical protein